VGVKTGKYYSVNVPLQEGIDDASYQTVFRPVIDKVMEIYQPTGMSLSLPPLLSSLPFSSFLFLQILRKLLFYMFAAVVLAVLHDKETIIPYSPHPN
jgi:hypothetical protein